MMQQISTPSPESQSDSAYAVLEAVDALYIARTSEIYLQAVEHYILTNSELTRGELLNLIRLYRAESAKGLDKTADILKAALNCHWQPKKN